MSMIWLFHSKNAICLYDRSVCKYIYLSYSQWIDLFYRSFITHQFNYKHCIQILVNSCRKIFFWNCSYDFYCFHEKKNIVINGFGAMNVNWKSMSWNYGMTDFTDLRFIAITWLLAKQCLIQTCSPIFLCVFSSIFSSKFVSFLLFIQKKINKEFSTTLDDFRGKKTFLNFKKLSSHSWNDGKFTIKKFECHLYASDIAMVVFVSTLDLSIQNLLYSWMWTLFVDVIVVKNYLRQNTSENNDLNLTED